MKKIYVILILLFFNKTILCQEVRLGGALNFLTASKYLNYQLGASMFFEYSFEKLPIFIQGNIRIYPFGELSDKNNVSSAYDYSVGSVGASVNYCLINEEIKPYIGLGIFYNSNGVSKVGHSAIGIPLHLIEKVEDNFSAEITVGFKFSARTPVNFIVEASQTINRPGYNAIIYNDGVRTVKKENFNFDALFLRVGLLFKL